jgi:micrococcal nuclease
MKSKIILSGFMMILILGVSISAPPKPVAIPTIPAVKPADAVLCSVVRVIDGDTIEVVYQGKVTKVRLQGIDTPETKHPDRPVEAYGPEASRFVINLLRGEKVYLTPSGKTFTLGKYGRLIACVYRAPDGLYVNAEVIRQGYGRAYTKYPGKHHKEYVQLERFAKQAKKGMWASSSPKPKTPPIKLSDNAVKAQKVYRTKTGTKYHKAGCSSLRSGKVEIPLKEARASGLAPCNRCKPN